MARTKSPQAHNKVIEAALELFAERGIEGTSVDAIAAASGVSKATIYKHWKDKDSLALEALGELLGLNEKLPVFDSGNLQTDLINALNYQPPERDPEKEKSHHAPSDGLRGPQSGIRNAMEEPCH